MGGRDEIGSKVMTHHFLSHTQLFFFCRWPNGDSVASKKSVMRSVNLVTAQQQVSTLLLLFSTITANSSLTHGHAQHVFFFKYYRMVLTADLRMLLHD